MAERATEVGADELRDTVDHVAIERLIAAYADICTRRAWPELSEVFAPDARVVLDLRTLDPIVLDGPSAIGDFIDRAVSRFQFFEFVVLNLRTMLRTGGDPDAATGRCWMSELRQDPTSGHFTTIYGLYLDDYRRTADGWRIAGRRYHSLARSNPDFDVFDFPPT